ncbi:MAG TPA: FliH/SctL family protein [Burkholderiaceae bacterium]|nr:FliH/SctL family protein [Burkholderiaceae bacterium]
MGAPDRGFTRFIPKELIDKADSFELQPLGNKAPGWRGAGLRTPEPTPQEIQQRAFERGREAGYAEAARIAQQVRAQHAEQIGAVLADLRGRFAELEDGAADAVVGLAFEIARQVLRREPALRPDAVLPVAREALALVVDQHAHPRVHVHPDDFELLQQELDADGRFKGARFVADAAIERGGCRVETPHGDIDGTLATRWHRVLADLGWPAEPLQPGDDAPPRH